MVASKRITRWVICALALVAGFAIVLGIRQLYARRARLKREAEYEKLRKSYAEILRIGMSRQQVEKYLSSKNVVFRQMCCVSVKRLAGGAYDDSYDDLVKIGQEEVPWFCSENDVYVAFQFRGSAQRSLATADGADTLSDVGVYHWLGGCL